MVDTFLDILEELGITAFSEVAVDQYVDHLEATGQAVPSDEHIDALKDAVDELTGYLVEPHTNKLKKKVKQNLQKNNQSFSLW